MRCHNHPGDEALGTCRHCGRGLCAACGTDVKGVLACQGCRGEAALLVQSAHLVGGLARSLGFVLMFMLVYGGAASIVMGFLVTPEWGLVRWVMLAGGVLVVAAGIAIHLRIRGVRRATGKLP